MTKEIRLVNSDMIVLVDDEDYDSLIDYRWRLHENGTYAVRNSIADGHQKKIYMHRDIMGISFDKNRYIDHIDGNKLNNQKSNLRFCTRSENNKNVKIETNRTMNSSSKYKGVGWYKKYQKWNAKIRSNNIWYNLGYFNDEVEAAKTYDKAALLLHKEFACLNFPDNVYDLTGYIIPKFKQQSSKYIGVAYDKRKKKFRVGVKVDNKFVFLGYYIDDFEAAKARDKYIVDNNLLSSKIKLNFSELEGMNNE